MPFLHPTAWLIDLEDNRLAVIDPGRHPGPFPAEAERRGARIAFSVETHLHADFVTGGRELAAFGTTVVAPAGADLAGPERRGLAMGLNEAAGYGAVAATALATGWIASRHGLRPEPFLLGVGTALVYPALLAAIGDVAHPSWRASAVGVYRLWRDSGYAVGALIAGIGADLIGPRGAVRIVGALTAGSGLAAARLLGETRGSRPALR